MPDERGAQPSYDRPIFAGQSAPATRRSSRPRLSLQGRFFLFALAVFAVLALAAVLLFRPSTDVYLLDNYQMIRVGRHDFRTVLITAGRVIPNDTMRVTVPALSVGSFKASVARLYVEPGDDITKGQTLVELVSDELAEEILQLEDELAAAEIELAQALLQAEQEWAQRERELRRAQNSLKEAEDHAAFKQVLYELGGAAKRELDEALAAVEAQRVQIEEAEHALEITRQRSELNIRRAKNNVETLTKQLAAAREQAEALAIVAERDGRVLSVEVTVGSTVTPGSELLTLADLRRQHVEANITPEQATEVRPGLTAVLRFGSYTLPATVQFVAPQAVVTSEGSAVPIRLALEPDVAASLVPNTEVSVEIELGVKEGRLALLRGPFFSSGDASFVYVISEDGKSAERRDVRFGSIDGSFLEVVSGLELGERIIYSSYNAFRSYPQVQLLPEGGREIVWP